MSKTILGVFAGLVLGAAATWTFLKHEERSQKKEGEHQEEPHVLHTNGQTFVRLDPATQQHAGLKLAPLEGATRPPEVKAYGRVLDPAPLASALVEITSARAALEATTKEFQRLKVLHQQGQNISTRVLETAEAALKRDQIAADAAHLKLLTGWGKAITSQPDLSEFVRPLVALEAALVRLDLPLGIALKTPPSGARVAALSSPDQPVEGTFLGPVVSADLQTQGQGFLFLLKKGPFPPNTALLGWLSLPGETENGVLVPRSSLVRHEGGTFIYLQTADGLFLRQEVELEYPLEKGWFLAEGLKPGQKVVITGAQQLLSEELKGEGGEE